ncbi:MAG: R3H domain-containing nucleic acid-binding protein [Pseudoclavibacter sp.]
MSDEREDGLDPEVTGPDDASDATAAESADAGADADEGEIAADYIEELLDIADLDGDIDIDVHDGRTYISVSSEDEESGLKALANQETVLALQDLTRLAVQQQTGEHSRLVLDIQGSRERRQQQLSDLVADAADRLDAGDDAVELAPMSSYERKLVHDLARDRDLESASAGEGRNRHVVLSLPDEDEGSDDDEDEGTD